MFHGENGTYVEHFVKGLGVLGRGRGVVAGGEGGAGRWVIGDHRIAGRQQRFAPSEIFSHLRLFLLFLTPSQTCLRVELQDSE